MILQAARLVAQTHEEADLIGIVFAVFVGDHHPLESEIENLVDLFDAETGSADLVGVGDQLELVVGIVRHHIDVDESFRLFEDRGDLLAQPVDAVIIASVDLRHDRSQCRRPSRLFDHFDHRTGHDLFTVGLDGGAETVHHHERGLFPFVFVREVDDDLRFVLTVFESRPFHQTRIVEGRALSQIDLRIGHLLLFLEESHDTLGHLPRLLDGAGSGGMNIDAVGVRALAGQHLRQNDLGRKHHDRGRERDQRQNDGQPLFAARTQYAENEVFKLFHHWVPPSSPDFSFCQWW